MAWQSMNAFIFLLTTTNTLAGLLAILAAALAATSATRLGSKRGRAKCASFAANANADASDAAPAPQPPLRRKAMTAALGIGLALSVSLFVFAIAATPTSYARSYRVRQALPADAAKSLRVQAARAGLFVGGLIRPDACDSHLLGQEFTSVTIENDLKWKFISVDGVSVTDYDFTTADALIATAEAAQVRVRGHVLIWDTRPQSMPSGLAAAVTSPETARSVMKAHIDAMAAHLGSKVHIFDVVNEPTLGNYGVEGPFFKQLGEDYILEAFTMARAAFPPSTKLFLNEAFGGVGGYKANAAAVVNIMRVLKWLKEQHAPIDGLGIQGHDMFLAGGYDKADIKRFMQDVSDLMGPGFDIEITELDARLALFGDAADPYEAQGESLGGWFEACAQADACKGVTLWGTSDAT